MKIDILVSVVAMLRNSAGFLPAFVEETIHTLQENYTNFELLLVDNASRDDTSRVVRELLARNKCIRYLKLSTRQKPETAIVAGLDAAIGDFVVTIHPEFDPPEAIPLLVDRCRSGADVAFGVAPFPAPPTLLYRILRSLFYRSAHSLLGLDPVRVNSGFRCLSRSAVNSLTRVRRRKRFFGQLASELGLTTATLEYRFIARAGKSPKVNLRRSVRRAASMAVQHSVAPLRLVSVLGLVGSSLSLIYSLYVLGVYFLQNDVMPGWTTLSLQVSGLFFLVFVILTVIGEHLGRLHDEVIEQPLYHVREERASAVILSNLTRRNVMDQSI